jgi:hypothetical protein
MVFSSKVVLHPPEIKVVPFALMWIILQFEIWRQRRDDPPPAGLLETSDFTLPSS